MKATGFAFEQLWASSTWREPEEPASFPHLPSPDSVPLAAQEHFENLHGFIF